MRLCTQFMRIYSRVERSILVYIETRRLVGLAVRCMQNHREFECLYLYINYIRIPGGRAEKKRGGLWVVVQMMLHRWLASRINQPTDRATNDNVDDDVVGRCGRQRFSMYFGLLHINVRRNIARSLPSFSSPTRTNVRINGTLGTGLAWCVSSG